METILCKGAEATIILRDEKIYKSRVRKNYRLSSIDNSLRTSRTRKELKALKKAKELGVNVPEVFPSNEKYIIVMEYIRGKRLRDVAISKEESILKYFKEVGNSLALLHTYDIIHGDLTTSNLIVGEKLYFIDFGLSYFSKKIEDMAVDLHVLEEALESTHHLFAKEYFNAFLSGYKSYLNHTRVLERLEIVRMRGRNK